MSDKAKTIVKNLAHELGFELCKFTKAQHAQQVSDHLKAFVDLQRHGSMQWMEETLQRRSQPTAMWQDAKSAIVLGLNYGPDDDPLKLLKHKQKAAISAYAQNRDYHDIIKGRLKQIAQKLASQFHCQVKVFVDTAPLMEKPLAEQAGLGWQGKHTNLVSKDLGSWLFLGVILTDHNFEVDEPEEDHCGSCRACLDICPTDAFPKPYQLDARKCISYLTIENSGPIPIEFRKSMGNRVYGCDDCLAVCPWNKFAKQTNEIKLQAREDLKAPDLADLLTLDDVEFRKFFSGSPIKRIGRDRFIRNVLIAAGNSGDNSMAEQVTLHLNDENAIIRASAVWALSQLKTKEAFSKLKAEHSARETDALVLEEWNREELAHA